MRDSGEKAKTMADIAQLAGVSIATASRALRDSPLVTPETTARVKAVAEEHNYRPHLGARNLRLRQSMTAVLVLPLDPATKRILSNPFILKFLGAVGSELHQHGYDFLVSQVHVVDSELDDRYLRSGLADGAIFLGRGSSPHLFDQLAAKDVPFVVWGPMLAEQNYCSVGIDNIAVAQRSVKHLIDGGRRRIAIVTADLDNRLSEGYLRYQGYREGLDKFGLAFEPRLVAEATFGSESGQQAMKKLLRDAPDLDAVFVAHSDLLAIAVMQALADAGKRIPNDVAVIGFDNIDISAYTMPPLTTVSQRLYDGGAALLVEKLLQQIAGQAAAPVMLDGELIIRQSSGAKSAAT